MPASGPVQEPKLFPARTMEDQNMPMEPVPMGTPAFSSPDPLTDGVRMLPLEDGTSAVEGEVLPGQPAVESLVPSADQLQSEVRNSLDNMSDDDLKTLAQDRGITVVRPDGNDPNHGDYVNALLQPEMQSALEYFNRVNSAYSTEQLDQIKQEYEDAGFDLPSLDEAVQKKDEQLSEEEQQRQQQADELEQQRQEQEQAQQQQEEQQQEPTQ